MNTVLLICIISLVIATLPIIVRNSTNYKKLYKGTLKENNELYSHIDYFKSALLQLHEVDYEYVEDKKYLFGDVYYICSHVERIYRYECIYIAYSFISVEGDLYKKIIREIKITEKY